MRDLKWESGRVLLSYTNEYYRNRKSSGIAGSRPLEGFGKNRSLSTDGYGLQLGSEIETSRPPKLNIQAFVAFCGVLEEIERLLWINSKSIALGEDFLALGS